MKLNSLEKPLLAGDERALAKWISAAEDLNVEVWKLLAKNYSKLGRSIVIGITGPPGAGKSTLVGLLVERLRKLHKKVGVLAVDPVSPFSQGALLGDRIRLASHFGDENVFIRSVSTRGRLGGLSTATREAVHLMDLAGFEWIFLETVGVGQSEIDVRRIADVTVVVLVPESGDDIQALKAGILEIGDLLVVNKCDRENAGSLANSLKEMVALSRNPGVAVLTTSHDDAQSIDELYAAIENCVVSRGNDGRGGGKRQILERTELIESWVLREVRDWMGKLDGNSANPYEFAIKFSQSWSLPGGKT